VGDIILISLREFELDKTGDVIHKYTVDEAKGLQAYGELTGLGAINEFGTDGPNEANEGIEFTLQEEEIDQI
jgi:hypothetical protein